MKTTVLFSVVVLSMLTCLVGLRTSGISHDKTLVESAVNHVETMSTTDLLKQAAPLHRVSLLSDDRIESTDGPRLSERFPNIDLIDHRGRNLKFYDDLVRDKSVCIVFFYTRCTGSCPGTTVTMKQLREKLKNQFASDEFTFISLTLEPEIDTPEELQEYMDRYQIRDNPELPEWIYATGDFEELDNLRRSLGVYDLDPIIDADKTEHAAILTFGNDRTDRWAALPTGLRNSYLADTIIRIAGNSERQRYASAVKLPGSSVHGSQNNQNPNCCEKNSQTLPACCLPDKKKVESVDGNELK